MIHNSNNHSKNHWMATVEIFIYACMAAVLIGQIFFINNTIGYANAALVMSGIIFGVLAAYRLTPITNRLSGKDVAIPADILCFANKNNTPQHKSSFTGESQRAA